MRFSPRLMLMVVLMLVLGAGFAVPSPGSSLQAPAAHAKKKKKHKRHRLRPICHRHERPSGKRHCVRAPSGARTAGSSQQGGPQQLVIVPPGAGLGGSGFDRYESAIAWGRLQVGEPDWGGACEAFVENAYNVTKKFDSALQAQHKLDLHPRGEGFQVPRGALVFFAKDTLNAGQGHVGISTGGGSMISALNQGVRETSWTSSGYWKDRFIGWAWPPDDWYGRFLVPNLPDPGLQAPPDPPTQNEDTTGQQPTGSPTPPAAPAVNLLNPFPDQTLSGVQNFRAQTLNASGVQFDAYYADDPTNPATLSWHVLGNANQTSGDKWSLIYDTKAIPDQGNPGWTTVNVRATALDSAGNLTGARDTGRVNISNAPSAPPPPPPPAYYVHHVVNTCADGACGLNKRSGPGYSSYPKVGGLYDGYEVDVSCQTSGENVSSSKFGNTSVWDRLTDGSYVTDMYVDTPGQGTFSSPIPHC